MDPTSITQEKNPKRIAIIAAGAILLGIIIVAVWSLVAAATAQPAKNDFAHLDNQRKVVDISMDAYDPMFTEFSAAYQTAYSEEQSSNDRKALKESFTQEYKDEMDISKQRIKAMDGSVALKNQQVHKDYAAFKTAYTEVANYTDKYVHISTSIIEVIVGSCRNVTKLEVSDKDHAEKFVKASNECLAKLADAKKTSTSSSKTLLTRLEKLFTERRDEFKKVVDEKDESRRELVKIPALLSILTINDELKSIQTEYETDVNKQFKSLSDKFDSANKTLSKTLSRLSGSKVTQEGKV